MKLSSWSFNKTNEYLPWILLVGLALGVANYSLGAWSTLGQSLVQQVAISFVIGYGLLLVVYSSLDQNKEGDSDYKEYGLLILFFALVGILGTEVEGVVRTYAFQQGEYQVLNFQGNHLFNMILSSILGFMTFNWVKFKEKTHEERELPIPPNSETFNTSEEPLNTIPIRQGEAIVLHPLAKIIYFEAYDNYSFLFDLDGKKHLCNYSLLFLEKKLEGNFLRVHRKYLINKNQIAQIKPHLKGRFVIEFKDKSKSSITSSTTYSEVIKSLIKL